MIAQSIPSTWIYSSTSGWWYRQDGEADVVVHDRESAPSRPWVIRTPDGNVTVKGGVRYRRFATADTAMATADRLIKVKRKRREA